MFQRLTTTRKGSPGEITHSDFKRNALLFRISLSCEELPKYEGEDTSFTVQSGAKETRREW